MVRFSILAIGLSLIIASLLVSLSNSSSQQSSEVGMDASTIFNNKTLAVGGDVKNIIILIPNEGHESPELPEEQRLINQPYVPENLIVEPGTNIVWFNGDVDHEHKITMVDENSNPAFESGEFDFNTLSKALVLNDTGKFSYSEEDVIEDDPDFVMKGTIDVVGSNISQPSNINGNTTSNFDTVAVLMVPAEDAEEHESYLQSQGLNIVNQYTFEDLREGDQQTLLIIGSKDKSIGDFESVLAEITPKLPYN
jgi:plastocyanin